MIVILVKFAKQTQDSSRIVKPPRSKDPEKGGGNKKLQPSENLIIVPYRIYRVGDLNIKNKLNTQRHNSPDMHLSAKSDRGSQRRCKCARCAVNVYSSKHVYAYD